MLVHGNSFSFAVLVRFDILQTCYKDIFGFKKPFFLKNTKLLLQLFKCTAGKCYM